MSLLNPSDPRIAAAQARVIETLTAIPDEYGAEFVIDDCQAELIAAVAKHHRRNEDARQEAQMHAIARRWARKAKRGAPVIDIESREQVA